MAFRKLRQFSSKNDGPKTELNIDATIQETCDNAGNLKLVFDRPRKNTVKVLLLFDSGGSMRPYSEMCSRLFQAAHKSNHFKDLKVYYFHNCIYQDLFTDPSCHRNFKTDHLKALYNMDSEYKGDLPWGMPPCHHLSCCIRGERRIVTIITRKPVWSGSRRSDSVILIWSGSILLLNAAGLILTEIPPSDSSARKSRCLNFPSAVLTPPSKNSSSPGEARIVHRHGRQIISF